MAILALNILGGRPSLPVRHLAPIRTADLDSWLDRLDWRTSTHKRFCSAVSPILASGLVGKGWVEILQRNVEARMDRHVWSPPGDLRPWRVISCIYHVLIGYDAAFLPYPQPRRIWNRLKAIEYERTRNLCPRTFCTDFDYAWVLYRLAHQLPDCFPDMQRRCNSVLDQMIAEWHDERERMIEASTHDLYCQCIGWAVFQNVLPARFAGPGLRDTLNCPWLFRLPGRAWVASEPVPSHPPDNVTQRLRKSGP